MKKTGQQGEQLHILHKTRDRMQQRSREFFQVSKEMSESFTDHTNRTMAIGFIQGRLEDAAVTLRYTYFKVNPTAPAASLIRKLFTYAKCEAVRKCRDNQPTRRQQLQDVKIYLVWDGIIIYSQREYTNLIKQEKDDALFKSSSKVS